MIKKTWTTNTRVDITFSLEAEKDADNAWWNIVEEIERLGGGWTSRKGHGGWSGNQEISFTISQVGVGTDDEKVISAVESLFDSGCEAVQVESWKLCTDASNPQGWTRYRCEEWRRDDG